MTTEARDSREPHRQLTQPTRSPLAPIVLSVALGALAGLGGYTYRYAEGLSYFKTDPEACVNCHIMQPQYDGWSKSSHRSVAVCVDCHLPEDFVPKYLAKAENGWRHGKLFTTQTFREPIEIQAAGKAILQNNCERCHADLVESMATMPDPHRGNESGEQQTCVHCHWTVGHGDKAGLGPPLRPDEIDVPMAPLATQSTKPPSRETQSP